MYTNGVKLLHVLPTCTCIFCSHACTYVVLTYVREYTCTQKPKLNYVDARVDYLCVCMFTVCESITFKMEWVRIHIG